MSRRNIIEGRDLSVYCTATPGNPTSTTFYWTNPGFRQNGSTLQLPNIQRTSSGTYRCTTENNYNNGEKGTDSQSMIVNVQDTADETNKDLSNYTTIKEQQEHTERIKGRQILDQEYSRICKHVISEKSSVLKKK
uniref:Uncharacterized protein n=1 Tax=Magallana gigas TaxID=29159 RepID=K1RBT9_MAGGI